MVYNVVIRRNLAVFKGVFEMKNSWAVLAILAAFLVLAGNSSSQALDTSSIDKVRSKGVLEERDLQVIDRFISQGVRELVESTDFTSIGKVRTTILSRCSSEKESAEAQYAVQLSESAYKHISAALEAADGLTPEDRKNKVIINLLIFVDGLQDPRLAELTLKQLGNDNTAIRYWAVHSVVDENFVKKLNSLEDDGPRLVRSITERLGELVEDYCPEILALIAQFAAEVNVSEGKDLLLQIADVRISRYADWTVEYELLEGTILGLLDRKINTGNSTDPEVARRFAQLYSYVLQRYVKGQDFLDDIQKQQLASVLVEIERSCIGKYMGATQSNIKVAIEGDTLANLLQEHSRLLGDKTGPGQLPLKLGFDYGKTADGKMRTEPLSLPELQ